MIAKSVNNNITRKINDWLESIDDERLKNDLKHKIIVTGGCIPSLLENNRVNDYDVYFRTKEITLRVAEYYVKKFKESPLNKTNKYRLNDISVFENEERIKIKIRSNGIMSLEDEKDIFNEDEKEDEIYDDNLDLVQNEKPADYIEKAMGVKTKDVSEEESKPKYRPIFLSSNAVTLSDKIQLIIRFYGEPADIHKNYDYIHCTNYWSSWDKKLNLNADALASLLTKELIYTGSKYPLCSIIRSRKFIKRGFTINAGQYLKMCMQLNELDLKDVDTLKEQLCGVDITYFRQVIDAMREYGEENEVPNRVDTTYLFEVINKLF